MLNSWVERGAELRDDFERAEPVSLLVIDGFVDEKAAEGLLAEFPKPDEMPRSRDYMFGDKHELSSVAEQGPASKALYDALLGDQFKSFISELTGKSLFVDPTFHGGGFHQSGDGGFLDSHVDFNLHPLNENWLRTLNILLYLNKDWKPEYDGRLLIRANRDDEPRSIEPLFNRGVLMVTNGHSWHGFKKMSLPAGVTRKSIATYAYELVEAGSVVGHTTGWAPDDDAGTVKRFVAKHYNNAVKLKTRFLGSATAKNR